MNRWIEGARPKTLVASIVPVLVGTAAAHNFVTYTTPPCKLLCAKFVTILVAHVTWCRFALALVVSIAIQVGVNYANDYSDGKRGVDTVARVGPRRLTASGDASHAEMKRAITLAFGVAGLAGLVLASVAGWWLLGVGAAAFIAALAYSGGPKPYANAGLGELFVFIFFGVVATVGSFYVQVGKLSTVVILSSIPVGFLASAILVVNNIRDIRTDTEAGKRTLAVRLGRKRSITFYRLLIALAFMSVFAIAVVAKSFAPLLALLALNFAVKPTMLVAAEEPPKLIGALIATARLQLAFGVLLAVGLWLR